MHMVPPHRDANLHEIIRLTALEWLGLNDSATHQETQTFLTTLFAWITEHLSPQEAHTYEQRILAHELHLDNLRIIVRDEFVEQRWRQDPIYFVEEMGILPKDFGKYPVIPVELLPSVPHRPRSPCDNDDDASEYEYPPEESKQERIVIDLTQDDEPPKRIIKRKVPLNKRPRLF